MKSSFTLTVGKSAPVKARERQLFDAGSFVEVSGDPGTRVRAPVRYSPRDLSRLLGLAASFALHGLVINSVVMGSMVHRPHAPKMRSHGAATDAAAAASDELMLVPVRPFERKDLDLPEQIASLGARLETVSVAIATQDPLPSMDMSSDTESVAESTQTTPEAGDPAQQALMFGRYAGQISARIERAWMRPRSPVTDAEGRSGSATSDLFTCRTEIRQDRQGNVREVLLLECNGTDAWRHSLVVAINQASPLPAPPIAAVFTRSLTLTFQATAYHIGMPLDAYEPERMATRPLVQVRTTATADVPPPPPPTRRLPSGPEQ